VVASSSSRSRRCGSAMRTAAATALLETVRSSEQAG
jgi:hypothetical protein